jgi:hypothetical protein
VTVQLPNVATTMILILVGEHGPLLPLVEVQGAAIVVELVNHLPEPAEGTVELRTPDGREVSKERQPFRVEPGARATLRFPLPANEPEVLIWARYDGDALAVNAVPVANTRR